MGPEQLSSTVYFMALVLGAAGMVLIFIGDMLRKNQDTRAGTIKFLGISLAALSVLLAISTYFVASGISRPLHLQPPAQK